jgi:hypothetical protein
VAGPVLGADVDRRTVGLRRHPLVVTRATVDDVGVISEGRGKHDAVRWAVVPYAARRAATGSGRCSAPKRHKTCGR